MNISKVLVIGALICFVLATLGVGVGTVNLVPLGLAFLAGAQLV